MLFENTTPPPYAYEQIADLDAGRAASIERLYTVTAAPDRFRANFISILESWKDETNKEECFGILNSIEHLILSDMLTWHEQKAFMDAPENESLISRLRELNIFVDFCFEEMFSESVLNGEKMNELKYLTNPLYHPYLERFDTLTRDEASLLQLSAKDTLLFIGGGVFPISAVQYVKQTGCTVHCLEKSLERAEIAKRVVAALGMENQIEIVLAEGQTIDCSIYDTIIVGVLAIPKKEIVQNIIDTAKKDARIICRTTIGLREALLAPMKAEEVLSLKEVQKSVATKSQILTPILYTLSSLEAK